MRPDNVEFILCYSSPPTKFDVLQTFKLFSKDNMVNRLDHEVQFINEFFSYFHLNFRPALENRNCRNFMSLIQIPYKVNVTHSNEQCLFAPDILRWPHLDPGV